MSEAAGKPSVLRGMALLARFRTEGFGCFPATSQGFLNSLAPLLAFPLVGAVFRLLGGNPVGALADALASLVALLAPAVVSHFLAQRWRREAEWLRYAVAFNWCQSGMTVVVITVLSAVGVATLGRPGASQMLFAAMVGVLGYWLALCWFLAAKGLRLSGWRAVLLVIGVNLASAVLVLGPQLLLRAWP
ncbi:MAG: hypothetical protein KGL55_02985 [Rhodospirillales bacterium]|nr:hypothetical protein [Rhodospirillales bacterium]